MNLEVSGGEDNQNEESRDITETAQVQIVHNSPYPVVDVYVDGALALEDVPKALINTYGKNHTQRMKFIVCLREPVNRTISSWISKKIRNRDTSKFESVIDIGLKQGKCIEKCVDKKRSNKTYKCYW